MSKQIKIVHVSDDNCDVSLNVGSINGVQEGDKFLVYSLSDHEIVDPDTGESLGYLEFVKGTGEVVHVQDKMCTITSVTYRKPVAKKTIRKTTPSMTMWAGSTVEEIVQDDNREQIPFRVATCTSMYQSFWRPWEDNKKNIWVRSMPKKAMTKDDFPFYNTTMWDYEFQMRFAQWIHTKNDAVRTCCLIGIRTQESFNRWRCIYMSRKFQMYHKYKWTSKVGNDIYNAYPIFDWKTTDVWTANGKFQWDYNILYDLYYRAGVNLERQRVASPFINEAQESLQLYRVLDPNTWGKMVGRVNGVNFTGMYGGTHAMGWQSVKLPEGYTWREFMYFLLSTLPERARKNYLRKLSVSVNFWRTKGGCLSDATIQKLIDAKVPIIVMDNSNYKTLKKPVRMEYQDDIDIPEFKEIPTYKRMCVCILKNDHACKYMGFSPTKEEMSKRSQIMEQYRIIVS